MHPTDETDALEKGDRKIKIRIKNKSILSTMWQAGSERKGKKKIASPV
jgi:hypothetical protein